MSEEVIVNEKQEIEIEKPIDTRSMIPIDESGKVMARNNAELVRYCGALLAGDGIPKRFDTPQKLFAALMFVRDLRLPDTAIRQVANIHGTPSAFGDLPLAMAQRTGEMTFFKEQWFDDQYNIIAFENKNLTAEVFGSVTWIGRGGKDPQSFSFTIKDAEKAGLYPCTNKDKPWSKYTNMMLRYRARSIGLKSMFADAVSGVAIAEYDFNEYSPDEFKDVTPKVGSLNKSSLNDALRGNSGQEAQLNS